ncbi:MAG: PhzF family phenazine biosynthesis protein [Defluviitaleaceae bacterium]|nr:PhzF family phenazine biosynthesis protein [Defluviitaleaceae bacterium]
MEYYIIDAFTDKLFGGNPAGVCLPENFPSDSVMQSIAAENNLSETAFVVKQESGRYNLRWFTPTLEIDLCGHATLASAFVLFGEREKDSREIRFDTASGELVVTRNGELLSLNFPAAFAEECAVYPSIEESLGVKPLAVYKSIDFMVLVKDEETLRSIEPNFSVLMGLKSEAKLDHDRFGIIVTAVGAECDFVSRYFAPNVGVPEDPVTGRAHCTLTPFWSKRLGKKIMSARQLSARGGVLECEDLGERVRISGKAVRYLKGEISNG